MTKQSELKVYSPDPAAVFASAISLWQECNRRAAGAHGLALSECYNGMDEFMREVMRVAHQFEDWACSHIAFEELPDVWPYLLEEKFGEACLAILPPSDLLQFDDTHCLRVAMRLRLPINFEEHLRIPVDVRSPNPVPGSLFREFRIQTMRDLIDAEEATPFCLGDDPFDQQFSDPYFGLYGVHEGGVLEYIGCRKTYAEALSLIRNLAPGVSFPDAPYFPAGS